MSDIEFAMSTYAEAARKVPAEKRAEAGAWAVWLLARRCAYEDAARAVERGRKCPGCGTANHEALIAQGMLDAAEILRCESFDRIWDAIAAIELRAEQIRDAADRSGVAGEPEATTKEAPEINSAGSPIESPAPTRSDPPGVATEGGTGRGDWMQTFTGRVFYPMAPSPGDVDPVDIAHALSLICRYGGHCSRYYSVAEHCVLMSGAVSPENALWALLHDATEAYVGDMVRPLKRAMPAYRAAEDRLMVAICDRFGLGHTCPGEVKSADNRIILDERAVLMSAPPLPWMSIEYVQPLGVPVEGWAPEQAERRYLARLADLLPRVVDRG